MLLVASGIKTAKGLGVASEVILLSGVESEIKLEGEVGSLFSIPRAGSR